MGNGVRHTLGAVGGVLATLLIAAGFLYNSIAAVAGVAILVGVLAGSRVSPLTSLLPGLAFAGLAGAALARTALGGDERLWYDLVPTEYLARYSALVHTWSLVIGCVLLAASVFPSRWRKSRPGPPPPPEEEETPGPPPLPKRIPLVTDPAARPAWRGRDGP
ncbi:hypothetical protein [Nonomuraea jiangxiensis]|uniref:Uncharacterized protein n=1 Tax=Nonomuraea jiangxiensis TaxID=633440 RepID=A0A1G9HGC5_9ACTN|nr:hypothetical protein [Nonomuraea jiangxiensis]SDL12101.1 hypothetical protein SAMN05421869_122103 [Nonomuraea jiangxiensis]